MNKPFIFILIAVGFIFLSFVLLLIEPKIKLGKVTNKLLEFLALLFLLLTLLALVLAWCVNFFAI